MAAKKSKSARPAPNASQAGSSSSRSTGNVTPSTDATQANTQQFTNKSKRKSKKSKKPATGNDAGPGNAKEPTKEAPVMVDPKYGSKDDPKPKDDPKFRDTYKGNKKATTAEKNSEKPIRSEPFIVNGMDRQTRQRQMSGSGTNNHANNTGSFQGHGATLSNISSKHYFNPPCLYSRSDQLCATEPLQNNLTMKPPARNANYHSRLSSYNISSSFTPNSSGSRRNNFAGPNAAQPRPRTGYLTPGGIIFGHVDSHGSQAAPPNPAGFHASSGPSFPTYPVPTNHGGSMYSAAPSWNEISNPFHSTRDPAEFHPGYPPVSHDSYGQPLYMPPYGYPYPHMAGIPSPPYDHNQDYDPYSSTGTPATYSNEHWSGHHHTSSIQHAPVQSHYGELAEQPQPLSAGVGSGYSSERQSIMGDKTITNFGVAQTENSLNPGSNAGNRPVPDTSAVALEVTPTETRVSSPGAGGSLEDGTVSNRTGNLDYLPGLPGQLLDAFQSGNWADYQLVLESASNQFLPITFPIHAVVVSRSPRLDALLRTPSIAASRTIRLVAGDSFLQPAAVETCLRHLYGLPILTQNQLTCLPLLPSGPNEHGTLPSTSNLSQMDLALCYIVTGNFLSMPEVTNRGFELAKNLIHWDTLERIMKFVLDPHSFAIETLGERASTPNSVCQGTSYREDGTESSTLQSESSGQETGKLMMAAFEFIADNLPSDFQLDTESHVVQMPDRIPYNPEDLRGTVRSNPRLATVKFGDFEPLNGRKTSHENTIISAILVALPFGYLSELFGIMKTKSVLSPKLAEEVVTEREKRRTRILRARKLNGDREYKNDEVKSAKASPLGWEESLQARGNCEEAGVTLIRTWTDFNYSRTTKCRIFRGSFSRKS